MDGESTFNCTNSWYGKREMERNLEEMHSSGGGGNWVEEMSGEMGELAWASGFHIHFRTFVTAGSTFFWGPHEESGRASGSS